MARLISVVIPCYNARATIGKCLAAVYASGYADFEVVVVDDCSTDGSPAVVNSFPCRLLSPTGHAGAGAARNLGAAHAKGEIIFFIDADCLVAPDTLARVGAAYERHGSRVVVGGTYTREPHDRSFFSRFQSVFIHYSELKKAENPDYIATHAMAIAARTFRAAGGFWQDSLPILEDVELSHRLRATGCRLVMDPDILVQHVFGYDFGKSLRNAVRKARYWTCYSLGHRDLLRDSGTASVELKVNVACWCLTVALVLTGLAGSSWLPARIIPLVLLVNLLTNLGLVKEMGRGLGLVFALAGPLYYFLVYPMAVGVGAAAGLMQYLVPGKRA